MIGKGTVRTTHESHPDACPRCDGFGWVGRCGHSRTCPACGGSGRKDDIVTGNDARWLTRWTGQTYQRAERR